MEREKEGTREGNGEVTIVYVYEIVSKAVSK